MNSTTSDVSRRVGHLMIGGFAVALAIASLLIARQTRSPATASAPALKILPTEATVEGGGPEEIVFTIQNTSPAPVVVTHVIPHCGCTVAQLPEPQGVPPGGESKLRVLATPPDVGERRSLIDVYYEGHADAPLSVTVLLKGREASAPALAYCPHETIIRGLLGTRAEAEFELTALENRDAKPWIQLLETDAPEVSAAIIGFEDMRGPTEDTVSRRYQCRAAVTLAARGRNQLALLNVRCNAPGLTSPAQIKVLSDCTAAVEAVPDTIFASLKRGDVPRDFTVRFRCASLGNSLAIEPTASVSWLEVTTPVVAAAGSPFAAEMHVRMIDLPEVQDGPSSRTIIVVKTNCPDCPIVEIPVIIHRKS